MILYELVVPQDTQIEFNMIPNGCVQFIFGYNNDNNETACFTIIGALKTLKQITLDGYSNYFCVQFCPDTFYYNENMLNLLNITSCKKHGQNFIYPSAVYNQVLSYPITETETHSEYQLITAFRSVKNFTSKLNMFLTYLKNDLKLCKFSDPVRHLLNRINDETGQILVSRLAEELCYSERHTNRLLLDSMGYGPKDFCKYVRFQNTLNELFSNPLRNNSEFIHNIGYSDQAHFQREFKTFTGITPKQYIRMIYML
jgi:AraC-like DNA-binding protein